MQLFSGELTNQNREYYKVNDNYNYVHVTSIKKTKHRVPGLPMVKLQSLVAPCCKYGKYSPGYVVVVKFTMVKLPLSCQLWLKCGRFVRV